MTSLLWLALMFLLTACENDDNQVSDPDRRGEPIWTIRAAISAVPTYVADEIDMSNLHAAIVWDGMKKTNATQSIPLSDTIPMEFDLEVFNLPPEEVLSTMADDGMPYPFYYWCIGDEDTPDYDPSRCELFSFVMGMLVVFVDNNQNGQLDLVEVGDAVIDDVVGGALNYVFAHISGDCVIIYHMVKKLRFVCIAAEIPI